MSFELGPTSPCLTALTCYHSFVARLKDEFREFWEVKFKDQPLAGRNHIMASFCPQVRLLIVGPALPPVLSAARESFGRQTWPLFQHTRLMSFGRTDNTTTPPLRNAAGVRAVHGQAGRSNGAGGRGARVQRRHPYPRRISHATGG